MKVCEVCGEEIFTRDGENRCQQCEETDVAIRTEKVEAQRKKANRQRRERAQVMRDLGLVKVRGALGGTYWE